MGSDEYSLHILCTTCAVQNILSIFFKHAPEDSVQQHILCISAGLVQHKFSSLGSSNILGPLTPDAPSQERINIKFRNHRKSFYLKSLYTS